jgi:hypothetical protein
VKIEQAKWARDLYNQERMRRLHRSLCVPLFFSVSGCALSGFFTSTSSEFKPSPPDTLESRLGMENESPNGKVDHFAVLIGANTELRHQGNLSMA